MIFFLFPSVFCLSKKFLFFSSLLFIDYSSFPLIVSIFCIMSFIFFPFISIYSYKSFLFNFLIFISSISMMLSFLINFVLQFLFLFEFSLFPMLYLILAYSYGEDKVESSIFMLVMNTVGSAPTFLVVFLIQLEIQWSVSSSILSSITMLKSSSFFIWLSFSLLFLFKLPLIFFHFWIPKAHVSASVGVSMILAGIMLKLASMGMVKFYKMFFFLDFFKIFFCSICFMGVLYMIMCMLRYFDQKSLVALSSILHMSLMPSMMLHGGLVGFVPFVLLMASHGVTSPLLFFLVGLDYEKMSGRSVEFSKSMESSTFYCSWFFLIFMLINLGLPPFSSFFCEYETLTWCFLMGYFMSLIFSLYFIIVIILVMFFCSKILSGKKILSYTHPLSSKIFLDFLKGIFCMFFLTFSV